MSEFNSVFILKLEDRCKDKYRKIKDPWAIFNILKLSWQLLLCQNLNNFASLKNKSTTYGFQHVVYLLFVLIRERHISWKTWEILQGIKSCPGGAVVENLPANAGDTGSSPGLGRSHMPRSD